MRCKWLIVAVLSLFACPTFAQPLTEHNQQRAKEIAQQRGWWTKRLDAQGRLIELQFIENGRPYYYITHNRNAADTVSTDECWPGGSGGFNLTGSGVTLGIWDGGAVKVSHPEFEGRATQHDIDPNNPDNVSYHATHVSGTMIAAGTWHGNPQYPAGFSKGMSYQAHLDCYEWNDDAIEMAAAAQAGLRASNHSYGYITGWYYSWGDGAWLWFGDVRISAWKDYNFGRYSETSQAWDQIAYDHPHYLIVKSAGNDRTDTGPAPGETYYYFDPDTGQWTESTVPRSPDGPYDCIEGGGIAKNVLTVGAVDDVIGGYQNPGGVVMTDFSSWGPADDGRIKPDISANGYELFSTYSGPDCEYCWAVLSGTSMASPNVTGSLGLLIQHWRTTHPGQADMRAATLKALVIHTADECGTAPGPDYSFGWGLLNTLKAAQTISLSVDRPVTISEQQLSDAVPVLSVEVPCTGNDPELRATLCWTDPPRAPWPNIINDDPRKMLVNDLDLRITDCDGTVHYPWVLDGAHPTAPATQGDNNTDNVEQIVVPSPGPGLHTITVSHKSHLSHGVQPFSLIVTGLPSRACLVGGPPPGDDTDCNGDGVRDSCQPDMSGTPVITGQPASATVCLGAPATFSVSTTGPCVLHYEWRKNGQIIEGANTAILAIAATTAIDAGEYTVAVSNPCGGGAAPLSTPATLTVRQTTIDTSPTDLIVHTGDPAVFQVTASGPGPFFYQWRHDGVAIVGAREPSYRIPAVYVPTTGTYDVVVTGSCTAATSSGAKLTVILPKLDILAPSDGTIEVDPNAELKWNGAPDVARYDVYFGTTNPPPLAGSTTSTFWSLPTLDYFTMYYWQVVPSAVGAISDESPVWSFRTHPGPPIAPAGPSPADGTTGVATDIELNWGGSDGATLFKVLIGQDATLKDARFEGTTLSKRWARPDIAAGTTYYWRVIAKSDWGVTAGPVWSFSTAPKPVEVPDTNAPSSESPTQAPTEVPATTQPSDTTAPADGGNAALTTPTSPTALCPATGAAMVSALLLGLWSTRPRSR